MMMWNAVRFRRGGECAVPTGGGAASVAIERNEVGETESIYFKYSSDGINWPDDSDAVLVEHLDANTVNGAQVLQVPGKVQLLVTNGMDVVSRSDDFGKTWDSF